jgi:hypothetical protein
MAMCICLGVRCKMVIHDWRVRWLKSHVVSLPASMFAYPRERKSRHAATNRVSNRHRRDEGRES